MGIYDVKPCPCGSGKGSVWLVDARGIPVARVCPDCQARVKARYRHKIFTNSDYQADERVEPEAEY